jgi:hypothetical protein
VYGRAVYGEIDTERAMYGESGCRCTEKIPTILENKKDPGYHAYKLYMYVEAPITS